MRLTYREEGDCVNVYIDGENGLQFIASAHTGLFENQAEYDTWHRMVADLYRGYLERQGVKVTSMTKHDAGPQGNC